MKCINEIIVLKVIFGVMRFFLVSITLFCDQGRKPESLEEKKKYNVTTKKVYFPSAWC